MSLRIAALAFATVSLVLATGCAAQAEGDEIANASDAHEGETEDTAQALPEVEANGVDTQATGQSCTCPTGYEYQAGLCYPRCATGYSGEGPVCWEKCKSTFTDTGFFCHRNSKIISADTSKCPWYNKCGLGSSCSKCPAGYSNDGCTCRIDAYIYAQPSYGRGAGIAPTCSTF